MNLKTGTWKIVQKQKKRTSTNCVLFSVTALFIRDLEGITSWSLKARFENNSTKKNTQVHLVCVFPYCII